MSLRVLALTLTLVSLVLAACTPSEAQLTRSELRQDPAASLVPPGAEALVHSGDEYHMTIDGESYAYETSLYRTRSGASSVIAYYSERLRASGWQSPYDGARTTDETQAFGWCKGRMEFRLGIRDPRAPMNRKFFAGGYPTVFETMLAGRDTKVACPG